jgi:hypothetical protein
MLYNLIFEDQFNVGPVYHGGTWDGSKSIKVTGRGALGIGAYFTPILEIAQKPVNGTVLSVWFERRPAHFKKSGRKGII